MNLLRFFLILISFALFVGCGGSSGGGTQSEGGEEELTTNPIATSTQFFGQNGNIWKPRADPISSGAGNLVVLFSSSFTTQFDSCELTMADGTVAQLLCINDQPWTQTPFSCFSNGGRQTWRANFTCDAAGEVLVTCRDAMQEVVFTVDEAARGAVCSRFG